MKALLLAPALLLALPAAAQSDREPYRAAGTEPFWSLTIDDSTIQYHPASGQRISVTKPRPIVGINGELYQTQRITVDITHAQCSDGMSDRVYADTVRLRIGRWTYSGCGGRIIEDGAPNGLAGSWRIQALNGRPVRLARPATLTFTGDRVSGRICNGFGGSYRFERGTLTTRAIVGTKMACMGGRTELESALLAVLSTPLKVSRGNRADTLVLSNARSSVALRRASQ
ncbi:META domain-containing protein [Sphingomonas sp. Leaf33]|uniref:META domain-containing protein n=1 Tax=Sphingomonas sp. Leaf33 TaxID=1736215 RepID=UPI000A44855E|nr:META domain-containing protein [Sphingomonas sp. Leaf33]